MVMFVRFPRSEEEANEPLGIDDIYAVFTGGADPHDELEKLRAFERHVMKSFRFNEIQINAISYQCNPDPEQSVEGLKLRQVVSYEPKKKPKKKK